MKTSRVVLLLSSLFLVAACGTKGPLVLPGKETPRRTTEPVELPRSADAATDDSDAGESADAASQPANRPVEPQTEPPTEE